MATEEETISPGEVQARKGEDGKVDILSTLLPLLAGTAAMGIGAAKGGSFGRYGSGGIWPPWRDG